MHKAGENFALPYAEGLRCKLNSKLPLFFLLQSGVKSQIYKREVFMKKNRWFAVISAMVMALAVAGCQINSDNHEHSFSKGWTSDATDHWHAATCGHAEEVSDKAAHTFGDYVSNNDATTESDGTKTRKCSVCGYEDTVTDEGSKIVATPAFSVASGAVDSGTTVTITCSTEGAKIYYTTDGSDPTASSTAYTEAISVTAAVTLKAIAVKSGMNDSAIASASYLIIPTKATCVPGDFVLKDGTMLPKDIILTDTQKSNVAAVIVRAATNEKPALGVGIVHNKMAWCTSASGYSTEITALVGDKTSGYMDGSDGWEKLKEACSDAESNPENYPAWNYSLTYAKNNGLTGDLATGWYLPTVAELYTIYQNKTAVDASLLKAGGSTFGTSFYWSCCQYPSHDDGARVLDFDDGYMNGYPKYNYDHSVCSVRAFN